jgi:hypothetical protein
MMTHMSTDKETKDFNQIRLNIGAQLRKVRESAFDKMSQQKFGEMIEHMDVANSQGRIAALEKGKGSADVIFSVLVFLYDKGIDINCLFGPGPMWRRSGGAALHPENVSDYVKEVRLLSAEAREKLDEVLRTTQQMEEHIVESVSQEDQP